MLFFTQLFSHRVLHVCVPHAPDTLSSYYSNFILKYHSCMKLSAIDYYSNV